MWAQYASVPSIWKAFLTEQVEPAGEIRLEVGHEPHAAGSHWLGMTVLSQFQEIRVSHDLLLQAGL